MPKTHSNSNASQPDAVAGLLHGGALYWALAALCLGLFLYGQHLGFVRLSDLSTLDADDGLRLQEVRDLAGGQGWFDTHQYRYLPPEGTAMHWSRLVDAPVAAVILALEPVVGEPLAERIAITAWPMFLLLLYLGVTAVAMARVFGARAAALSAIMALNLIAFRDHFGAGAIDHHNLQIVLVLASVIAFAFAASLPIFAVIGGVAAALSLAVGLESLPFIACVGFAYTAAWIFDSRQAKSFAFFGGSLALASLAAFAAQTAPSLWLAPACDVLSPPWLLLAFGCGAAAFLLTQTGSRLSPRRRFGATLALGLLVLGVFAVANPDCLAGPYGAVPVAFRAAWLELTGEALGLGALFVRFPARAAVTFGPTLAAAAAAWVGALRSTGEARRLLFLGAIVLTLALLLSLVQIRAIYIGVALTPVAAGWALDRILARVTAPDIRASAVVAPLVAGLLFFEFPWALSADLAERAGLARPAAGHDPTAMRACLHELPKLRPLPEGVILGPIDLGAHILFLTDHAIVAAGYHRNVEGIVAGLTAFAGSEQDLRDVVARDRADYVALCLPWIDAYPDRYGPFAQALAEGTALPAWLEPVSAGTKALRLWRVR